jgi:hypothetical protein
LRDGDADLRLHSPNAIAAWPPYPSIFMVDLDLVRERLGSSVISDVLDGMGLRGQAMDLDIRPL